MAHMQSREEVVWVGRRGLGSLTRALSTDVGHTSVTPQP